MRFPKGVVSCCAFACVAGLMLLASRPVAATVSGPCVNCHTMHNSQGGAPMAYSVNISTGQQSPSDTPNPGLLKTDCIGCHMGTNSGTAGAPPYVFSVTAPNYGNSGTEAGTNTLSGGNFYWVANGNDRAGHNVTGLAGLDSPLGTTPPGGSNLGGQLTCAGGNTGCHGVTGVSNAVKSISGAHHGPAVAGWQNGTGTTVARSYRAILGLQGLEDSDYEYQPTSSAHNKYYGVNRGTAADTSGTISSHCGRCHGNFHSGSGIADGTFGAGVWLRHPTDFDMSVAKNRTTTSEYADYNKGTNNAYSVVSPVATADTSTTLNTGVYKQSNDAIVMCLSCHRAHGTPFNAILRWNYRAWPGDLTVTNGCAVCHTAKD